MPGPTTEILNDDIKDLRREIRTEFDLLKNEIHSLSVALAELRAEVRVTLGVAKWAGALVVTTVLTTGVAGIWWASGINARVDGQASRMEERSKAMDARFDRLDAAISRAFEAGRSGGPALKSAEQGASKS